LLRANILDFNPSVVDFVCKIIKLGPFSLEFLVDLVEHLCQKPLIVLRRRIIDRNEFFCDEIQSLLIERNHAEVDAVFIVLVLFVHLLDKNVFIAEVAVALHKI